MSTPPPSVPTKIAFGIGSSAETIHFIGFSVFSYYLYTQVIGLQGYLVGLAVGIALVFDAVSDPLVGLISDRLRTRFGRRHLLMFLSSVPTALFFAALFAPPVAYLDTQGKLFAWLVFVVIGLRLSLTLFTIPHIAFGSEMVSDYVGRSKVMAYHTLFLWCGGALTHFVGLRYFFAADSCALDNCLDSLSNYHVFGLFWGVALMATILTTTLGTLHRVKYLSQPAAPPPTATATSLTARLREHAGDGFGDVKHALANKNYQALLLGMICMAMTSGIHETVGTHMVKFFWELSTEQYSIYAIMSFFGFAVTFALGPRLHGLLEKRTLMVVGAFGLGLSTATPVILRLLGWFPENGHPLLFPLLLLGVLSYYTFNSFLILSVVSVLGDVADQYDLEHGKRREGIFYSARNFFGKMSSGGGHLLGGVALSVIAFPVGETRVENIPTETIADLGLVYATTSIFALGAAFCYSYYRIDGAHHRAILAHIEARNASAPSPPAPVGALDRSG